MKYFYPVIKCIVAFFYKIFYFYQVKYEEKLPIDKPYIICPNHMQYKDPILILISSKKLIYFMAKNELFNNKILARVLPWFGVFPVKRGVESKTAVKHAKELLKKGKQIGIFMEGTRSKDGKLLTPKAGAIMLAAQCNAPIVPVSISCKKGKVPRLFRKVTVHYGKEISLEELGIKEGKRSEIRDASKLVMNKIKELRDKDI